MAKELTEKDLQTRRLKTCVQSFPNAETGEYNPRCCRFPKNCSPYGSIEAYQAGNISENDLESESSVPVRFEPATSPQADRLISRREPVFQAEQKILRQFRVGDSFQSSLSSETDKLVGLERGRQVHRLEAYVLQEHLADDVYLDVKHYSVPRTWWDHLKASYMHTWWGRLLNKRTPARFENKTVKSAVQVERYASYPEADVAVPQLGRPIPFESVRRLTEGEIEDMEAQKQMEAARAETDEDETMWVYLLVPETIDDLVKDTGLPKEHFEAMYRYDQDFGLNSKIYLIPEGVGYRHPQEV